MACLCALVALGRLGSTCRARHGHVDQRDLIYAMQDHEQEDRSWRGRVDVMAVGSGTSQAWSERMRGASESIP
ncbi:hypothetical protein VFPBJ_07134 [Purpureocillium lilacinum]|uniref:Secreted protein n=1 Tax=Purpureocillium lilacinum TaxID=33203 RepID=A0A179GNX5_PURLI|nr:hypothetical protein VFPBJ_07134 [Purpureocillium lilacinum]